MRYHCPTFYLLLCFHFISVPSFQSTLSSSSFILRPPLGRMVQIAAYGMEKSEISSNFGRFPSLTHLDLSSSCFSSPVPYEISYLSKLDSLHLSFFPFTVSIDIQATEPILKLENLL
ncbi:receptor-like protein 12 [Gossypium australe]|uniref:Receptor-like protein 12 n=1 Tax=Gossypium australe TaxID=47621 RepID=A0A5B6VE91_9ROSI|nr:receptor-like protein 12 [Gossypium australe]